MESVFLSDKRVITMCFNPSRDSVFALILEGEKLELIEEDISKMTILKRFNILKFNDMIITNPDYRKLPNDTYEGYLLYYWELIKKLILVFPFGYLIIYDYATAVIVNHFQCTGKLSYLVRNITCSPLQRSIFLSAEGMRNVYHLYYDNIKIGTQYQKLIIPKEVIVNDILCHPNEKFLYVACSDGIVRLYDYNNFTELPTGLVDVPLGKDGKPLKNQIELIKKNNILAVSSIDINSDSSSLISGNDNGYLFIWDAISSIKDKRDLKSKEKISNYGIISAKFIRTKQLCNLNRFLCLSKEGKLLICNLISIEENKQIRSSINKLYENSIFYQVNQPLLNYNISASNFINCSLNSNLICIKWPIMKIEKIKINAEKTEDYIIFLNFIAKFFFLYDNNYPMINFPLSTQMIQRKYEDYIPISNTSNLIFDRRVFLCDSNFVYCYDIMTGINKKILNYSKEFNFKNITPLKFDSRPKSLKIKSSECSFILHYEKDNLLKSILIFIIDINTNIVKTSRIFDDIIDYVILGDPEENIEEVFLLQKNKQTAIIYKLKENKQETRGIDGTILRAYWTPLNLNYTIIYRNILNELKFSANLRDNDLYNYKVCNELNFRLEYSEREIDLIWQKIENDKYYLAITMVEKIVITDESLIILYTLKSSLLENLNIISSVFWMGKTLFYTKGNNIVYYYPFDSIEQKIFSSDHRNIILNGLFADRIMYSAISSNNLTVFTPPINILEPLLIGYLDYTSIDYNLVKEAITMMFTNQFSQHLIEKLLKKDLKEICWMLINDSKSSFHNLELKLSILNDLLKFDLALDLLLPNKNLKNELELDEIMWKINYDQNSEILRNLLSNQTNILINFGQFDLALKFLELLNDFPKAINLLFLASSKEEFEKTRSLFMTKNCLSYSDANLMNNLFFAKNKTLKETNYSKIFDNYKGETLIFGSNFDKINLNSIKDVEKKVNKKNSFINNIQNKKLSFGESAFHQYVQIYNDDIKSYDFNNICNLVIQKFDQFYGYKNTFYEKAQNQPKKTDFMDYNIPLSEMKNEANQIEPNQELDNTIDPETEEFQENQYLSAYFHFEKSTGLLPLDITDNNTEGYITIINLNNNMENEENKINDESIWTNVLEEFEPIEYEDKWGRKGTGAHAIKFSSIFLLIPESLNTSFKIKHNSQLAHFAKKFTAEFWIKLFSIDVEIFQKDILKISLQNNQFICIINNKIIPPVKLKDYNIICDKWTHLAISYKKKEGKLKIFLNCEEVLDFSTNNLDELGKKGEIIFGNSNLEGEITEIRIWNQVIPIKFLTNNHKSPLPILAENKRKLKMKINKQDDKKKTLQDDKGFGFRNQSFLNTKFAKPKESVFLNQSYVLNKSGIGKSQILNVSEINKIQEFHKENPIPIMMQIPEEKFINDNKQEPTYPGFTFESPNLRKNDAEDEINAPSFISVIQHKDIIKDLNTNVNFDPNDFQF